MKNGFDARGMMIVCAVAGCLAGFGIDAFMQKDVQRQEENAKDNTLLREEYDGVFFGGEEEIKGDAGRKNTAVPTESLQILGGVTPTPSPTTTVMVPLPTPVDLVPNPTDVPEPWGSTPVPTPEVPEATPLITKEPTEAPVTTNTSIITEIAKPTQTPDLAEITPKPELSATPEPVLAITPTPVPQEQSAFTYPAEIFGQTPVVNRSDAYVTYFEFAMELIETLEGEIRQKNLNEVALFTRFMLKALFCGIDIQSLKINDPIPRAEAALAMHLAAEIMGEKGTGTTARSAAKYVTDITGCSSAERKAIAYLYEQGMEKGYQVNGQRFSPNNSLKETDCAAWFARAKECWK